MEVEELKVEGRGGGEELKVGRGGGEELKVEGRGGGGGVEG